MEYRDRTKNRGMRRKNPKQPSINTAIDRARTESTTSHTQHAGTLGSRVASFAEEAGATEYPQHRLVITFLIITVMRRILREDPDGWGSTWQDMSHPAILEEKSRGSDQPSLRTLAGQLEEHFCGQIIPIHRQVTIQL